MKLAGALIALALLPLGCGGQVDVSRLVTHQLATLGDTGSTARCQRSESGQHYICSVGGGFFGLKDVRTYCATLASSAVVSLKRIEDEMDGGAYSVADCP